MKLRNCCHLKKKSGEQVVTFLRTKHMGNVYFEDSDVDIDIDDIVS